MVQPPLQRKFLWRQVFKPSPDEYAAIDYYLSRTTLFWNFCVHHLSEDAVMYINEPNTEESTAQFIGRAKTLFDRLKKAENDPPSGVLLGLRREWVEHIPAIMEVPESTLRNRLSDLINAYLAVKSDQYSDILTKTSLPRRKTQFSAQTVRFNPTDYAINGNRLSITGPVSVNILMPELHSFHEDAPQCLLITRKPFIEPGASLGPMDLVDRMQHTATFRPM